MYQISNGRIRGFGQVNGRAIPLAVDAFCPSCKSSVTYRFDNWSQPQVQGLPKSSSCPGCRTGARFIWLDAPAVDGGDEKGRLYMDAERVGRPPLEGIDLIPDDEFPEPQRAAYRSALNVLNINEPEAGAAAIRRALEGIVKRLVPSEKGNEPLAIRLRRLAETRDPQKPLTDLTDALRVSGNLAAHFDEDRASTSIEDAYQMLDLFEFFIEYMFILPRRIEKFKQSIAGN